MEPSVKLFRGLMLTALVLALLDLVVTFALPELVPEPLRQADEQITDGVSTAALTIKVIIFIAFVSACIVAFVGLYRFRPWAPITNVVLSVASLFIWLVLGYNLSSGLAQALSDAASMVWGAVLALAYFTPIRSKFARNDS